MKKLLILIAIGFYFSTIFAANAKITNPQTIRYPIGLRSLYPSTNEALSHTTKDLIDSSLRQKRPQEYGIPKAIIVPHYGLHFSGPVAATAFATWKPLKPFVKRVILISSSHQGKKYGISLSGAKQWEMPNQTFDIDEKLKQKLLKIQGVGIDDNAHEADTSIEVQLPFISETFDSDVKIMPILIDAASTEQMIDLLDAVWGDIETVIVLSTNLSSGKTQDFVDKADKATVKMILEKRPKALRNYRATSRIALSGFLYYAIDNNLLIKLFDKRTSTDILPLDKKVLGFASFGVFETPEQELISKEEQEEILNEHKEKLLRIAAQSIVSGFKRGRPLILNKDRYPPELQKEAATFVNIYRNGDLRGNAGSISAEHPIITDIAQNAYHAVFSDFRFVPLSQNELADSKITITYLTPPVRIKFRNEKELLEKLKNKKTGIILKERSNQALFLPQIWDTFSSPKDFISNLKQKAGLSSDYWSSTLKFYRFETIDIHSDDLVNPASIWIPK